MVDYMLRRIKNISMSKKIQVYTFILPVFLLVFITLLIYFVFTEDIKNDLKDNTERIVTLLSSLYSAEDFETLTDNPQNFDSKEVNRMLDILESQNLKEGTAYYIGIPNYSDRISTISFNHTINIVPISSINKEVVVAINNIQEGRQITISNIYQSNNENWVYSFMAIQNEQGDINGVIGIQLKAEKTMFHVEKIASTLLIAFLLCMVILYFYYTKGLNKFLKPLNEIINGLHEVSVGNLHVELEIRDHSDIGIMSERFNEMIKKWRILFSRLANTSKVLGNYSNDKQLQSIEEALIEMENIMEYTKVHRELQRAEKMNALGQLAASVAHEIRNPMTVVKGFLQIFLAKEHISEEERMYIKLMIEEMNRAETIINDYLSLVKPSIEQVDKIDGKELSEKVIDLMSSYAMMSKNISFEADIKQVYLRANNNELKQVLINIVKNGIEAMKNGGALTIKLYKEAAFGVFEIADTGIGMTEDELSRLGTAFYSLKEKGTGIGLMVCYQMIDQMKGKIEVSSRKGVGTTFKVFIPLY